MRFLLVPGCQFRRYNFEIYIYVFYFLVLMKRFMNVYLLTFVDFSALKSLGDELDEEKIKLWLSILLRSLAEMSYD